MSNGYQLPKFKRGQDPKEWINFFNIGCKVLKVKDEEKLDIAPGYFRDKTAVKWFFDHNFTSWTQFEDCFSTKKKQSTKSIINKTLNIKKGSNESVREYNDRFDHLIRNLNKKSSSTKLADEEYKDAYVAGLHPSDLRRFVKRSKPKTLKDAQKTAKEEEESLAESDISGSESDCSSDASSSEEDDSNCADDGKMDIKMKLKEFKETKNRKNQSNATKINKSTRSPKSKTNETKKGKKQGPIDEVISLMKNLTLLIQTQTSQQQGLNQPQVKATQNNVAKPCFNCQGDGHLARDYRPCKLCKGSEGDHSFWECKYYSRKPSSQAQSSGAANFLVISQKSEVKQEHAHMEENTKVQNLETYAAEKRQRSGAIEICEPLVVVKKFVSITQCLKNIRTRNQEELRKN